MSCGCHGVGSTPSVAPLPTTTTPAVAPLRTTAPAPAPTGFDPTPAPVPAPTLTPLRPVPTTHFQVGADQPLLDAALGELRRSPTGASILGQLEQTKVQMKVLDDPAFDRIDKGGSAAFYAPAEDTMYLRRSWLQKSAGKTASLIAHEGQHALDDQRNIGMTTLQARAQALVGNGPVTEEAVKQAGFEVNIAKEARGYLVQGQVLKELGLVDPAKVGGPLLVAAQGQNDRATYDAVYRGLVNSPEGGYNPEGRKAEPIVLG
jgi:hypothetical protein